MPGNKFFIVCLCLMVVIFATQAVDYSSEIENDYDGADAESDADQGGEYN